MSTNNKKNVCDTCVLLVDYSTWISCETKLALQNLRERGIYPGKAPIWEEK